MKDPVNRMGGGATNHIFAKGIVPRTHEKLIKTE